MLSRLFGYGRRTSYVGTNGGRQGSPTPVYVRLRNGREIQVKPLTGEWMGPTKVRPYPDFEEV